MKTDNDLNLIQKIELFMGDRKYNFEKHFLSYREISIKEASIKYKGRLGIVQYMTLIPAKRGIKIWMMRSLFLGCY